MKTLPSEYIGDRLSHGTLRNEDLIPDFMDFLQSVKVMCRIEKELDSIQKEVDKLNLERKPGYSDYYKEQDQETANYILNEDIWDLLNDIAPKFTYFGSTEGDGSDFGFWTYEEGLWEYIQEDIESAINGKDDLTKLKNKLYEIVELIESHDR